MLELKDRALSRDEFTTMLTEAASIVNNTPLWAVPTNPNDLMPLTPNMLLTLRERAVHVPLAEFSQADLDSYGQRRYRRVQHLSNCFWRRWRQEYLLTLTKRHKWHLKRRLR